MTATFTRVDRHYVWKDGLAGKLISYVFNSKKSFQHSVIDYLAPGETSGDVPEVYRKETVEEARKVWKMLDTHYKSLGWKEVKTVKKSK